MKAISKRPGAVAAAILVAAALLVVILAWYPRHRGDPRISEFGRAPVELVFSLLPASCQFAKGRRMRLTVTFADADNFATTVLDPAPRVRVLRGAQHASYVEFPAGR